MIMDYETFKRQYQRAFQNMMSYSPKQAGSQVWAEAMAKLADEYPDWAERAESEKS